MSIIDTDETTPWTDEALEGLYAITAPPLMRPATHEQLAAAFRRLSAIQPDPPDVLPMPEDLY